MYEGANTYYTFIINYRRKPSDCIIDQHLMVGLREVEGLLIKMNTGLVIFWLFLFYYFIIQDDSFIIENSSLIQNS